MSAVGRAKGTSESAANRTLYVLGHRIRETRLRAGIGLRELARRVGCSPGLISKIEHGTVAPSVPTLYAITRELHVPMDDLFSSMPTGSRRRRTNRGHRQYELVRSADGVPVRLPRGVEWRELAVGDNQAVEFREIAYDSGGMSSAPGEMLQHEGHEHGLVIEGRFSLQIGDEVIELSKGDSIAFGAQIPHRLWNAGRNKARAIWLIHANSGQNDTHS